MRRRPASRTMGLLLAVLVLTAGVGPAAAHALAHRHESGHHPAVETDGHEPAGGHYSHSTDGHVHVDSRATLTTSRPVLPVHAAVRTPTADAAVLTLVPVAGLDAHRRLASDRTHDPPGRPRAPPTR